MTRRLETGSEYKPGITFFITDETRKQYDDLAKQFRGCYPRLRWKLLNMSIKLMAKTVKERKLKAGDDLEEILGI